MSTLKRGLLTFVVALCLSAGALYVYRSATDENAAWRAEQQRLAGEDDARARAPLAYPPAPLMSGVGKRYAPTVAADVLDIKEEGQVVEGGDSQQEEIDALSRRIVAAPASMSDADRKVHEALVGGPIGSARPRNATRDPSAVLGEAHRASLLWGSYTPAYYFAMRTRAPRGTVSGLMWMGGGRDGPGKMRHLCAEGDNMRSYGWFEHDGRTFGVGNLDDTKDRTVNARLEAAFAKVPGDPDSWSAKVSAKGATRKASTRMSLFFYIAVEGSKGSSVSRASRGEGFSGASVTGVAPELVSARADLSSASGAAVPENARGGKFEWKVEVTSGDAAVGVHTAGVAVGDELHRIPDVLRGGMRVVKPKSGANPYVAISDEHSDDANVVVVQVVVDTPAVVSVSFRAGVSLATGYDVAGTHGVRLADARGAFSERFAARFNISRGGYTSARDAHFAEAAVSNMIGGMGYFHGKSLLTLPPGHPGRAGRGDAAHSVPGFPVSLFTAVPSRPFFPRGFLWDEGFHHLIISRLDRALSLDSLGSWLSSMHGNGWIPREQILGAVAETKVPGEFVPQHPEHANPPTLLLAFESLFLSDNAGSGRSDAEADADAARALPPRERAFLLAAYPRLRRWFNWFVRGQMGGAGQGDEVARDPDAVPVHRDGQTFYYWRGRDVEPDQSRRLNPRTLTSGLDDYPRALFPTDTERHVDLHAWVAHGAEIMARLAALVGDRRSRESFADLSAAATRSLVPLMYDRDAREFRDYGLHARIPFKRDSSGKKVIKRHVRREEGAHGFVPVGPGYVSAFPLLLRVLDPVADAEQVGAILDIIEDPQHLWSKYGLRSISTRSPFYRRWNNEGDKPYWRGPVWLNVNYLALTALRHYAAAGGPHAERAADVAARLASNIHWTVSSEYVRRFFVFENYDDKTGAGTGCHPFTGWSALAVLAMELATPGISPDGAPPAPR